MKKIFILIMGISILLSLVACTKNNAKYEKVISEIIEQDMLELNDNKPIKIGRKIKLQDLDSNIIAEYIELENYENEYIGYIIIDKKNGVLYDHSNEGKLFGPLLEKAGLTYEEIKKNKVYFAGPFDIIVKNDLGQLIELMSADGSYGNKITQERLEDIFKSSNITFGENFK